MKTIPANITLTLAAGSESSPYYYNMRVRQQLCQSSCVDEQPSFRPSVLVKSIENVGISQYEITCHIEGTIHYIPCGCNSCATRAQLISQDVVIPVFSTVAITTAAVVVGCQTTTLRRMLAVIVARHSSVTFLLHSQSRLHDLLLCIDSIVRDGVHDSGATFRTYLCNRKGYLQGGIVSYV